MGGLAEMTIGAVGGAATAWTGGSAVLGALAVYHGSDVLVSGIRQMLSGETTQTLTEQGISSGLQKVGVRKEKAEVAAAYADLSISMLFSFGSGMARSSTVAANFTRPIAAKTVGSFFHGGRIAKASELVGYAEQQGWKAMQSAGGPLKYVDESGVIRMTIKQGTDRAAGSGFPHVELRNALGKRIDAFGNEVTRKGLGNHAKIIYDLK